MRLPPDGIRASPERREATLVRRAVSAALELHAFMRSPHIARRSRGHRELAFHTGIVTGLVLAQSRD